ncbi:MAG TPA: hypothetical protein EYP78_00090 [Candidatus Omnitrophica bacterium]|nr:hypothetical protein [Candidatus Omnitrophota bacterium]
MKPRASGAISIYAKSLKVAEEIKKLYSDFLHIKPPPEVNRRGYRRLRVNIQIFYQDMLALARIGQVSKMLSAYEKFMNSEDGKLLDWILVRTGRLKLEEGYKKLKAISEEKL